MPARALSPLLPLLAVLCLLLPGQARSEDPTQYWLAEIPLQRQADGSDTAFWPSQGLRWPQRGLTGRERGKVVLADERDRCVYAVELDKAKKTAEARVERNGRVPRGHARARLAPSSVGAGILEAQWPDLGLVLYYGSIEGQTVHMGFADMTRDKGYTVIHNVRSRKVICYYSALGEEEEGR